MFLSSSASGVVVFFLPPKKMVFRIWPGGACAQDHDGQPRAASACGGAGGSSDPHDAGAAGWDPKNSCPILFGEKIKMKMKGFYGKIMGLNLSFFIPKVESTIHKRGYSWALSINNGYIFCDDWD